MSMIPFLELNGDLTATKPHTRKNNPCSLPLFTSSSSSCPKNTRPSSFVTPIIRAVVPNAESVCSLIRERTPLGNMIRWSTFGPNAVLYRGTPFICTSASTRAGTSSRQPTRRRWYSSAVSGPVAPPGKWSEAAEADGAGDEEAIVNWIWAVQLTASASWRTKGSGSVESAHELRAEPLRMIARRNRFFPGRQSEDSVMNKARFTTRRTVTVCATHYHILGVEHQYLREVQGKYLPPYVGPT